MKISKNNDSDDTAKFGKWQFSIKYGIINSPKGKTLLLEPRLSKLLYFLSLNVDNNVSRNYLVENIWKDTIVNEESLTRAVSDLRKLLIINFKDSISIQTIRRRGYVLLLEERQKKGFLPLKVNPVFGYYILGLFLLLVLMWSIGSILGIVETKFLMANK